MSLQEQIQNLASRCENRRNALETEEATKNALIMPFIQALGYDIFDPTEVVPEYTADHGVKRGEKVDYAILNEQAPIILFECKSINADIDKVDIGQLYRYFSVTQARVAVLTNGRRYKLFSDLEERNKMDAYPFLDIDIKDGKDRDVNELNKISKQNFDTDSVLERANQLKYMTAFKRVIESEMHNPSDDFVRTVAKRVYDGRLTSNIREEFRDIIRKAFRAYVNDQVNDRLESAMESAYNENEESENLKNQDNEDSYNQDSGIVTTEEELEGFRIIKAILRNDVDVSRVVDRDVKSYFGVLLDDNNRKPICRLHFNTYNKYIGIFDMPDRSEDKIPIEKLDDIYRYADRIRAVLAHYEKDG